MAVEGNSMLRPQLPDMKAEEHHHHHHFTTSPPATVPGRRYRPQPGVWRPCLAALHLRLLQVGAEGHPGLNLRILQIPIGF
jgi:hypothetical protein